MRSLTLLAFAAVLLAAAPAAHGRLFWQTYGATVPAPGGGCAWNVNSDYFVPRTCDAGRYDLFSPCKAAHGISPACKYLHPIHGGYCTPYGPWHYHRRDYVYKKYCGCTPLKHSLGPWHLEKCRKHCGMLRPSTGGCQAGGCQAMAGFDAAGNAYAEFTDVEILTNVEPFGGERLGEIAALPSSMAGAAGAALPGPAGQFNAAMPPLTPAGTTQPFSLPGLFGN